MNYIVNCSDGKQIPIDEDEIEKALIAMSENSVVVFRQGVAKGAFISTITEDTNRKKGYNYGYKDPHEAPYPNDKQLPDKFKEVRELLQNNSSLQLGDGK